MWELSPEDRHTDMWLWAGSSLLIPGRWFSEWRMTLNQVPLIYMLVSVQKNAEHIQLCRINWVYPSHGEGSGSGCLLPTVNTWGTAILCLGAVLCIVHPLNARSTLTPSVNQKCLPTLANVLWEGKSIPFENHCSVTYSGQCPKCS